MVRVCVVGAGVVGLCSALNIKRTFPNFSVTIVAEKFYKDTTSYGAGGVFRPNIKDILADKDTAIQWIRDSWRFFDALAKSAEAQESGLMFVPSLLCYNTDQDAGYQALSDQVYDFHKVSHEEMLRRNLDYKYGYAFTTVVSQPPTFLRWLLKQFFKAGGQIQKKTIKKLEELSGDYDVVINCCGLGAETLVGERNAYPVKGQLVMLKAPFIRSFIFTDDDMYVIPHTNRLVVGGTREKGNYNNTVDPIVSDRILAKAEKLLPQLKGAEVLGTWSGLRPYCSPVRLKSEILNCGPKGRLVVIHNYGHGGHGVSLSWGCSEHVVRLLKESLKRTQSSL